MESEKKADDHWQEDDRAVNVELFDILAPAAIAEALRARLLGGVVEEGDEGEGDRADGKVDVEAPAPCELVREGSSHQGAGHRSDTVHAADHAHVCWTLAERNGGCDDEDGSREDSCGPDTSDCAANDQSRGVGSSTTDGAADLEDDESREVYPFDAEEGVQLSEEELECTGGQEVSRPVPTDICY